MAPSASLGHNGGIEARARASRGISGGSPHYAWAIGGVEDMIRSGAPVLDLGCGVGLFGRFLNEQFGCKAHGCDVVRHVGFREEDYAAFELRNIERPASFGRQFDLIFAIGLVEYFPDPRAFIEELPLLLTPQGKVVLTAPNPASLLSLLSLLARGEFSAFREISNPASITPVLAIDACRMFREAGFNKVAVDYSPSGRLPLLRSMCYQQILPFVHGRWWSDNFRIVASMPSP